MNVTQISNNARSAGSAPVWAVRAAAIAATVALLALSAPVIWAAVSTGLGLVAVATMVAGGVILFQAIPLGLQRLENRLLRLRKAEARANPIEQLQNEVLRRAERLQAFRRALANVGGQIESIAQMVVERRHADPGLVLDRQLRALDRLKHFYAANLRRLDDAHSALEDFRHKVKQKEAEWTIALAIEDASAALNPGQAEDLLQDLLTDVSLRSIQDRFNAVFAELDIEMRAIDAPTHDLVVGSHLERLEDLRLPVAEAARRLP